MTDISNTSSNLPKARHGCLTAFLILLLIANSGAALIYLFSGQSIRQYLPNMPSWTLPVLIGLGIFSIVCAIALFRWKRWGFWGYAVVSIGGAIINISIGQSILIATIGVCLSVGVLYGVLHIGKNNKAWPQLE